MYYWKEPLVHCCNFFLESATQSSFENNWIPTATISVFHRYIKIVKYKPIVYTNTNDTEAKYRYKLTCIKEC